MWSTVAAKEYEMFKYWNKMMKCFLFNEMKFNIRKVIVLSLKNVIILSFYLMLAVH